MLNNFVKSPGIETGGKNNRGARQTHKRLRYYFNVNRTSLDHLLLGKSADIDKCVECPDYSSAPPLVRTSFSLAFGFGNAKAS